LCAEIAGSAETARQMGAFIDNTVDSIYFGGGTPTLLDVAQLESVFVTIGQNFEIASDAEITVECAPGTLSEEVLRMLVRCEVNRVSLGVQSFVDQESASVGRIHKRATVIDDVERLRSGGISNINIDLIAGLPHQTRESWDSSLKDFVEVDVPHASIYMLEVDEDSRLGRELIAGGQKYHAHFVPDDDLTVEMYEIACERLSAAGIQQYEISNFAGPGFESKHNLKYWTRQPYLGFGVDAHSMLYTSTGAVRFSNPDSLEKYSSGGSKESTAVPLTSALQEAFFLGLRLNRGIDREALAAEFGEQTVAIHDESIAELTSAGLLEHEGTAICLTRKGKLLSNEVFERFLSADVAV
jgi:oxygen-independent coproporphyrinogen-3 oxidase